jgi:hypothetical protein
MGLIADFLKRKDIDALAKRLANQFADRLPTYKVKDEKRLRAEFELILGQIQGYHRKEKLGALGQARLINGFQWELVEKGYDKDLSLKLGRDIASLLSKTPIKHPEA